VTTCLTFIRSMRTSSTAQTATFYGSQGDNTGRTNFEYAQFLYDSIVVVSHPVDDVFNVNHFVGAVALLLELGFGSGLPLRGAVGLGSFLLDQERGIFLSECFPDLVRMEKRQEWAGCVVLSDAEQLVWNAILGVGELPGPGTDQKRNQLVHMYGVPAAAAYLAEGRAFAPPTLLGAGLWRHHARGRRSRPRSAGSAPDRPYGTLRASADPGRRRLLANS
jgi:hypothetical protein